MKKMLEPSPASASRALVVRTQRKLVAREHQASFVRANNCVPTAHGMSRISTTRMIPDAPTDADAKALLDTIDIEKMQWRQVTVAMERLLARITNFARAYGGTYARVGNPNMIRRLESGATIYWDVEATPLANGTVVYWDTESTPIPPMPTRAEAQAAFHRWQQAFPAAANYMAAVQSKYEKQKSQIKQRVHPSSYPRAKRGVRS